MVNEESFEMDEIHISIPGNIKGYTPIAVVSTPGFDGVTVARTTILGHNHESEMPFMVVAYEVAEDGTRTIVRGDRNNPGEFFFTEEEGRNGDVIETFWGWAPTRNVELMTGFER